MERRLPRGSARNHNRSDTRRGAAVLLTLACLAGLASADRATASVTIGQLAPGAPTPSCTTPGVDYLEPSVTGGNLYVARQAGTITSWTTTQAAFGARYVVKIFRRTPDPDVFQVVARTSSVLLASGINTVPTSLPVKSGDMLGVNTVNSPTSCTFGVPGDSVLTRMGDLSNGSSGTFSAQNDVRLNLSAVLVPDNSFTIGAITRDRKRGTAEITVTTSNPGGVTMSGKGLKKRGVKSVAVAGPVTFALAAIGRSARRLARTGKVAVPLTLTFFPTSGDPSSQSINVRLRMRVARRTVS